MKSLSKSEIDILAFLIRNFSTRYTIRNIATLLGITPPGAHAVLKKLEGQGVVKAEKLGTGLFYDINLENSVARHLASIMLLDHFDVSYDIEGLDRETSAIIYNGKKMIIVTSDEDAASDWCYDRKIESVCLTEDALVTRLQSKDDTVLDILKKGNVLHGEDVIVSIIKRVMR